MNPLRHLLARVRLYPASTAVLLLALLGVFGTGASFEPEPVLQPVAWTLALPLALYLLIRILAEPRQAAPWRELACFPLVGFLAASGGMAYALVGLTLHVGVPSLANEVVGDERVESMTVGAKSDGRPRVSGCRYWVSLHGSGEMVARRLCVDESAWQSARTGARVTVSLRYSAFGYRVYAFQVNAADR